MNRRSTTKNKTNSEVEKLVEIPSLVLVSKDRQLLTNISDFPHATCLEVGRHLPVCCKNQTLAMPRHGKEN